MLLLVRCPLLRTSFSHFAFFLGIKIIVIYPRPQICYIVAFFIPKNLFFISTLPTIFLLDFFHFNAFFKKNDPSTDNLFEK